MTDITFITSNQTKVAHARYLCKGYDVNILKHKKLFYGVGYNEPRFDDREALLRESFDDAVKRWKKNVSNPKERLFFIEDTSVRIDALSDDQNEIPGVDVKYWMQTIDFKTLDNQLKAHGNNRKASVSSHIILFLTDSLKERLGTKEDYRIFQSTSYGSVTETECCFQTQILYPWLDNKSFNKWFVPEGYSSPISTLRIEDADNVDFRKGAFQQMLLFLKEHEQIKKTPDTLPELRLQFDDIFIVCGPTCSGKSTTGKYLVDQYGYYHIEASEFMMLQYLDTHGAMSAIDRHEFAAEMLKVAPLFVVDKVIDYLRAKGIYDKFIITGFRTQNEVDSFLARFYSTRLKLVYLNADFETRYERWVSRKRDAEIYTRDRFLYIDQLQQSMGVENISKMKEIINLNNNRNGLRHIYTRLDSVISSEKAQQISFNKTTLFQSKKVSLEKAILVTLALLNQSDDTMYYTTTEISKQINKTFKQFKKNKNNISRYFNQSYYLYYEVKKEGRKVKYKISPIGYSEVMRLMRQMDN